jgi:hypothetical protein
MVTYDAGCQNASKTLPGFKIDFGSKVFLIERIKAISTGERE